MAKEKKKVPNLRFKGFTDDWEQRKLGEISDIKSGLSTNTQSKKNLYKITRIETISDGFIDVKKVGTVREKPDKKFLMNCGDILFSNINSLKHIGKVAIFDGSFTLYHGMNLLRITVNTKTSSYFIYYELSTKKYRNWAKAHANPAVSQASINQSELSLENMSLTSLAEQEKIVNLLLLLDKLISLQQQKLDLLKQLKKGLLQKMFADKSKFPILRFEGFHDEWEQRKLGELYSYHNGKAHEQNQRSSGKYELINLNSISVDGTLKSSGRYINHADEILRQNDLVMILSDIAHGTLLGRVAIIPQDNKYVLNQRVALLRPISKSENSNFMAPLINNNQRYFHKMGIGTSQLNISKSTVIESLWQIPKIKEQSVIGNFLQNIDHIIALQHQKLAKYQSIKKSLLQQMFM